MAPAWTGGHRLWIVGRCHLAGLRPALAGRAQQRTASA